MQQAFSPIRPPLTLPNKSAVSSTICLVTAQNARKIRHAEVQVDAARNLQAQADMEADVEAEATV